MYDVAVIGLGMMGSAALRYLSKRTTGLHAVGIGPGEPQDWTTYAGPFASHYDQARITRITDPDTIWATLAQRAIDSYAEIEQASNVRFHYPVGHLRIDPGAPGEAELFTAAETIGRALNASVDRLDHAQLVRQFPYLNIPAAAKGLYEHGGAGFINPRALVAAQLAIAEAQGAALVREAVVGWSRVDHGFLLTTGSGQTIRADRVLLCTHGYTNLLLASSLGQTLDLVNMAHSTVYAEVSSEQARQLAAMPSLIWPLDRHPVLDSVYTTPAMPYADGRSYLKIGGPLFTHPLLETPAAMREWFQSPGNPIEIQALREVLIDLIPGLQVSGWKSKPCMNTYTAHGYPYVDQLGDGVFVCTGGCGSAAKSSDEIGRMGALLVQYGRWLYDLPASSFHAVRGTASPSSQDLFS